MTATDWPVGVPLNELDQNEWWDVCREVRPDLSRADFEAMWADFVERKASGALSVN